MGLQTVFDAQMISYPMVQVELKNPEYLMQINILDFYKIYEICNYLLV